MNNSDTCHTVMQSMLPWYVNGTLGEAECEAFETHLANCKTCASAFEQERAFATTLSDTKETVPDAAVALADFEDRHDLARDFERSRGWWQRARQGSVEGFVESSPLMQFFAIAQAAVIAVLAVALVFTGNLTFTDYPASYRTVSNTPAMTTAQGVTATFDVVFAPEAQQATITALLEQQQAQIIAGPNAAGAYTLAVKNNVRAARTRFQSSPMVEFVGAATPVKE